MKTIGLIFFLTLLTGCANDGGSYIDINGNIYTGVTDNAAYNMAIRDAYVGSEKALADSMMKMRDNPMGQMAVGMAYAFNKGQGPAFQKPKDWVDKTMQLYPLIRDVLSLVGWGIPSGGYGSGGGAIGMERVNIGGDFYANGSIRNDRTEANGYQANVDLSRSGGSVTEDNDVYEGNAQSTNTTGEGDNGPTVSDNPYSDDDSLLF